MDTHHAILSPSPMRRLFATGALGALGVLPIWLTFARPPSALYLQVFLLAFGVAVLMLAHRLWVTTAREVFLTDAGLFDSTGDVIAPIEQILKVDRSPFAIKPSNGFLVVTRRSLGRHWAPGLWWRVGRHIGVGGVTPATQGKGMADVLSVMLAERATDAKD